MGILRRMADRAIDRMESMGEVSEDDLARMSPDQRAHHEYWTARAQAARAGGMPGDDGEPTPGPAMRASVGAAALRPAHDTPPIEDPDEWRRVAVQERAARDAARAPYLSPHRRPVTFTRIATRGGSQWDEVAGHLASSGLADRPDLVYGLYRVPDHIASGLAGMRGGVVEWDIVHAAGEATHAPASLPVTVRMPAKEPWVERRAGQASLLDEDLAVAVLARAGMGPERTLGIARDLEIRSRGGGDDGDQATVLASVTGVGVIVPAGVEGAAVAEVARRAPVPVPEGSPPGVRVTMLDWEAIARLVHPVRRDRPRVPSPYPQLPATPQELLRAYLEIVGISPADAYGAAVTHDLPVDLMARSTGMSWLRRTGGGDRIMCADGKERARLAGGDWIVVTHRDDERYAAGRERFAAYLAEVLRVGIDRTDAPRPPVPKRDHRLLRAAGRIYDTVMFFSDDASGVDVPAVRYCWPPTE